MNKEVRERVKLTDKELVEKCLLTDEEIGDIWVDYYGHGSSMQKLEYETVMTKAQLTKAIPIIRQAVEKELRTKLNTEISIELGSKAFEKGKRVVAEEIKGELEKLSHPMNTNMYGISIGKDDWQAFWKDRVR